MKVAATASPRRGALDREALDGGTVAQHAPKGVVVFNQRGVPAPAPREPPDVAHDDEHQGRS